MVSVIPTVESNALADAALQIAATVVDPEIPVLTIQDLGILRNVEVKPNGGVRVELTPTYTGCPAVLAIELAVSSALAEAGIDAEIVRVISPAWTTDWISDEGRQKLREYGICPPASTSANKMALLGSVGVSCPRCNSGKVSRISEFGSTACKALYRCDACKEPFDYFKCI